MAAPDAPAPGASMPDPEPSAAARVPSRRARRKVPLFRHLAARSTRRSWRSALTVMAPARALLAVAVLTRAPAGGLGRPRDLRRGDRRLRRLGRPSHAQRLRLLPRRARDALVGGRPLGDGHPDQRDHVRGHDRAGLHGGDGLPRVLLRPAVRDGRAEPHARAVLLPRGRLHRVPVPRAALRRAHSHPDEPLVPALARAVGRRDAVRAVARPVGRLRLERDGHDPGDGRRPRSSTSPTAATAP